MFMVIGLKLDKVLLMLSSHPNWYDISFINLIYPITYDKSFK